MNRHLDPRKVLPPLETIRGDDFDGKPVPERDFHVPDMVPGKTVTMLGGDGGTGKSLLALQLAVATVVGGSWCHQPVKRGACIYVAAEDDLDELHRRLVAIANGFGVGLDRLGDLHIVPLAGADALLAVPDPKAGALRPTDLALRIEAKIAEVAPVLAIGDTLSDLFGGQENERAAARQFVGLLRGWAIRFDLAFLLLAHPSLTGISSGSGLSGSTAWNNSVRSRLYLDRVKDDDGFEADPDVRVLRVLKSNYGRIGAEVRLRWQDGIFEALDAPRVSAFGAIAANSHVENRLLELLAAFAGEGRRVSPHPTSNTYAPTVFAKDHRADGITRAGFEAALSRLFADGRVAVERSPGPPSKQFDMLVQKARRVE